MTAKNREECKAIFFECSNQKRQSHSPWIEGAISKRPKQEEPSKKLHSGRKKDEKSSRFSSEFIRPLGNGFGKARSSR